MSFTDSPTSQTPLARRLWLAVAAPVALLLALGVTLTLQIARMATTARWVDHTDEVIAKVSEASAQIADEETGVRGFLITDDRAFLGPWESASAVATLVALRTLVSDNPTQVSRVDDLRGRYDALHATSALATAPGGSPAQFRSAAHLAERRHAMDGIREVIAEILRVENTLRTERVEAQADASRTTFGIAVPLFIVFGAALAFVSRRSLSGLATTYNDAFAREQATRASIETQAWIRAQLVKLSEAIQGDLTLEEVGRRALALLTESVGAVVAAFYAAEPGGFRRYAGHALDPAAPTWFGSDDGLVGRAAREAAILRIGDVPPDFLRVKSGTGERDPVEIVFVPAHLEGTPLAIVELGFFAEISPRGLELLSRVGEMLAVAVRAVQQKERLRELLEEAQRQGEELQTQQEELRVANEELRQQGDALRTAHAQLEERQEELTSSNASLAAQRDALEDAQRALAEKAADVERASRYKSEFLANMSHELRTPLNSSLILAKLLADNKLGNLTPEQVRFATTIYAAGNDLLALINDILDLSKIEAGKVDVNVASHPLARLVEPISRTFEPVAKEKKVAFKTTFDPASTVETDAQRVQQILKNLLSNAFKFTEKGEVALEIDVGPAEVRYVVRDTGIGIPAHQQEVIFEAFRQADGTANRRFGGTGLGLSISRDLARLLGGELTVESAVGTGSRFVLALPRVYVGPRDVPRPAPPLPPIAMTTAPSLRRPTAWRAAASDDAGEAEAQCDGPAFEDDRGRLDPDKRVLLIIEDDVPFAEILANLAREHGFQFLVAHGADEGVRLAVRYVPSAILLDMNLPDHSGLSVLDRLKRNAQTRHIPIHVLSVLDYAQTALSMGAIGYLMKPVAAEDLARTLTKLKDHFVRARRLLLVEDDAVQRDATKLLLGSEDVEIVGVATVAEALEQLRASTFDCVVTDLALPDATGFELLERMAADEAYSFPPVIVYTGRTLTPDEEVRLRRFSSSIIVKGVRSPDRLLDEVTLFLHQVEAQLPADRQRMLRQARDREASFEGRKILLAEDDVRNIFALTSVLEPKGAELLLARNGREALELLEKTPAVDLVLMDIMMPEMDGLEAMRAIRSRTGVPWSRVPIIALTAKAMKDDQERCIAAGANDFIAKPLDIEMLLSLMRVWVSR